MAANHNPDPLDPDPQRLCVVVVRGGAEADGVEGIVGVDVVNDPGTGTVSVAFIGGPGSDRVVLTGPRFAIGRLLASACKRVAMIDNPSLP